MTDLERADLNRADLDWLTRISAADVAATARTRRVVDTPAFRLLLDPQDDFGGINWATPLKADPDEADIQAMRTAFLAHQRTPRLEFLAECWPGLPARLERAGLRSEGESQEIMLVTPDGFRAVSSSEVSVQVLSSDDPETTITAYLQTQTAGFGYGGSDAPTAEQITGCREQLRAGRRAVLAVLAGRPVGVGTTLGSELAELQGVTTLPDARRRGVAATVSSALVAQIFAQGGEAVWLSVEDAAARACYAKLGFRTIGARLNYSTG
jgi:ribosomal protein S18 acetylase RimI-like enzyme